MENQHITFTAKDVHYGEAIGGELVQLTFDENPGDDSMCRTARYFMVSHSYEIPGGPTLEWYNGRDYDGGSDIVKYIFTQDIFEVWLENDIHFTIQHHCSNHVFSRIETFLESLYPGKSAEQQT
jgi:hypothetical protein